jgi:hypothetical protein
VTRLLPDAQRNARHGKYRAGEPNYTLRHTHSIGITFPVSISSPSPFPGPGVTPPVLLGIMDLGYLEARSRDGLVLTRLGQNAADTTTLEG